MSNLVLYGFPFFMFLNQSIFNFKWQLTQRAAGDLWTSHKMPIPRFTLCFQSNNKYISEQSKLLFSTIIFSQNYDTSQDHQNIICTIICRCISPNSHIVISKINWRSCKMFKYFSEEIKSIQSLLFYLMLPALVLLFFAKFKQLRGRYLEVGGTWKLKINPSIILNCSCWGQVKISWNKKYLTRIGMRYSQTRPLLSTVEMRKCELLI